MPLASPEVHMQMYADDAEEMKLYEESLNG